MRAFFRLAALWELTNDEQRALLGWPPPSTFYKYKAGQTAALPYDTLTRISLLLGIYKDLHILYPDPGLADRWVRLPNSNPLFGGKPALTLMSEGGMDGLQQVRRLLDGRRGRLELMAADVPIYAKDTCRLVPTVYPSTGILDRLATPEDLSFLIELESWTNDRISTELGLLHRIPKEEWVSGRPMSSVVMAAFCHPRTGGGRFNSPDRGAWYAALDLATAHAEVVYHRTAELAEIGVFETRVQMRLYRANFKCRLHDVRADIHLHHPTSYAVSQAFARELLESGSNGVIYRSVRRPGGECIACFRPRLVTQVRPDAHFEYRWEGGRIPKIRKLSPQNSAAR